MPVASTAFTLSSPPTTACKVAIIEANAFTLSSPSTTACKVAIIEPNVLQTASTAKYLQAQRAVDVFAWLGIIQSVSEDTLFADMNMYMSEKNRRHQIHPLCSPQILDSEHSSAHIQHEVQFL